MCNTGSYLPWLGTVKHIAGPFIACRNTFDISQLNQQPMGNCHQGSMPLEDQCLVGFNDSSKLIAQAILLRLSCTSEVHSRKSCTLDFLVMIIMIQTHPPHPTPTDMTIPQELLYQEISRIIHCLRREAPKSIIIQYSISIANSRKSTLDN